MFTNIIGNDKIKQILQFKAIAAKKLKQPLSHTLFVGPPGCGKTSFARALADELGTKLITLNPRSLRDPRDLLLLTRQFSETKANQHKFPLVFIDEIHSLNLDAQEMLGILMEEFRLSCQIDGNTFGHKIPGFTLIGATTQAGSLSKPFRDRFSLQLKLETYSPVESAEIVKLHGQKLGLELTEQAIVEIASRGKGIPRLLIHLVESIRDYVSAQEHKIHVIDTDLIGEVFNLLGIDSHGLDDTDRKFLTCLATNQTKPIGIQSLALQTNEPIETLVNVVEPYLLGAGMIIRTLRGRLLTPLGEQVLAKLPL